VSQARMVKSKKIYRKNINTTDVPLKEEPSTAVFKMPSGNKKGH
jgi:hypothetical protein